MTNTEVWLRADNEARNAATKENWRFNTAAYFKYLADNYLIIAKPDKVYSENEIIRIVAQEFGMETIPFYSRKRNVVAAKQISSYLLKQAGKTYKEIGKLLHYSDHSVPIYNVSMFEILYNAKDPLIYDAYQRIAERLNIKSDI